MPPFLLYLPLVAFPSFFFFFSSRRRHTRFDCDWSSDVCSSDLFVNPLTMWLTVATFIGYAVLYTLVLKPATPQNIVIGGASGAMPPVLGWAAVTREVSTEAMLLFLIIFAWTPPRDRKSTRLNSRHSQNSYDGVWLIKK